MKHIQTIAIVILLVCNAVSSYQFNESVKLNKELIAAYPKGYWMDEKDVQDLIKRQEEFYGSIIEKQTKCIERLQLEVGHK